MIDLELTYHAGQDAVFSHPARRKVLAKGRRWGFTRGAAQHVIEQMLGGVTPVLWGDTINANITNYVERYFIPVLHKLPSQLWQWKKQEKKLLICGAVCDFRSADQPENWEGFGYKLVILNEAGIILRNQYLWHNAVRPMLMDYPDSVAIIGGCVSADTIILPKSGAMEIGALSKDLPQHTYDPCDIELYGVNKSFHKADSFYYNGEVATKKILTKAGYELEASLWHPIFMSDFTWKRMSDLKQGDKVLIDYGMEVWGNNDPLAEFDAFYKISLTKRGTVAGSRKAYIENFPLSMDNDFAWFLGLWLAEGSYEAKKHRITITCGDVEIGGHLEKYGFRRVRKDQWRLNSKKLAWMMKYIGMPLTRATQKYIPKWLWDGKKEWACHFISGYLDGDGHVRQSSKKIIRRTLGFSSSSKRLLKGLQLLLLNLGAVSRLSKINIPPTKKVKKATVEYQLHCHGIDYETLQGIFSLRIERKNKILKNTFITQKSPTQRPFFLSSPYYEDVIVDIADSRAMTYDFTIPDTHSFWTNGFISHNTPKGKNLFHELHMRSGSDGWQSFMHSTYDNPFLQKSEIEEMEKELPESIVRQEIYAEFVGEGENVLIAYDLITACINREAFSDVKFGAEIWGLDVARHGDDFSVLAKRHYKNVYAIKTYSIADTMQLASAINAEYLQSNPKPLHIFVETTGIGWGVYDRLRELRCPVIAADVGTKSVDPMILNKRAEMYTRLHAQMRSGLKLPDIKPLIKQLANVYIEFNERSIFKLVAKEKIKKEIGESPDHADAVALTFFDEMALATERYIETGGNKMLHDYDPLRESA